jgi:hypothetical protein
MHAAAASAGMFTYNDVRYPRVQLLSIRDILEQKREFRSPSKVGSRISTVQVPLPIPPRHGEGRYSAASETPEGEEGQLKAPAASSPW